MKSTADLNQALSKQLAEMQLTSSNEIKKLSVRMQTLEFEHALDIGLLEAGVKNIKVMKAFLTFNKLSYSGEYGIQGLDEQLRRLKVTNSYLFDLVPAKEKARRKKRIYKIESRSLR